MKKNKKRLFIINCILIYFWNDQLLIETQNQSRHLSKENQSRTPKVCLIFVQSCFPHVTVTQFNTSLNSISGDLCLNLDCKNFPAQ